MLRLIRRLIRDYYTRGYNPEETLKLWENVRQGEEVNIFPYQDEAERKHLHPLKPRKNSPRKNARSLIRLKHVSLRFAC